MNLAAINDVNPIKNVIRKQMNEILQNTYQQSKPENEEGFTCLFLAGPCAYT